MRRPAAVVVSILIPPLAAVLAWSNILRRRDLKPSLKGLWIVLCSMPVLGPLLDLGIGGGRFQLIPDRISGFFVAAALVFLIVAGVNRTRGSSSHTWQGRQTSFETQVQLPASPIPYVFKRAWTLQYRYACPGLHAPKGLPPNTFLRPVFRVQVSGALEGISTVDSRGTASQVFRLTHGGTYRIRLHIRRGCTWSLRTGTA